MDLSKIIGKKDKHGSTSRKVIICMNVIFLLITLGICGVGALLRFGEKVWKKHFDTMMENLSVEDMDFSKLNFDAMFSMMGFIMMCVGLGAVIMCIFGFVSASNRNFILSLVYTVFLGCLMMMQCIIIGVIGVKRSFVDGMIKPPLIADVQGYRGFNGTDAASQTWGFLMVTFSCCGVEGYTDFRSASNWNRRVYQEGWWFTMETPLPCCKMRLRQQGDFACAVNPNDANSNFSLGCYDAVLSRLGQYRIIIIASVAVFGFLQIVLLLSSIVFTIQMNKKTNQATRRETEREDTSTNPSVNHQRQHDENDYQSTRNTNSLGFPYPGFSNHNISGFQFGSPISNMFPGYKPSMASPFGLSSLLNSMHAMPGMGFPMFNPQRQRQFGDIDPIYTQREQGLNVEIPRSSGPVIVQLPAITAPSERRHSCESIGGLTIEDITDTDKLPTCALLSAGLQSTINQLRRQNTAPVSVEEPVATMRRQNTWQPSSCVQRQNVLQRQNTVNFPGFNSPEKIDEVTTSIPPNRTLSRADTCGTIKTNLVESKEGIDDSEQQDRSRSETF